MGAKLERTRHPGIYKRGSRYVVAYRVAGRQKRESTRTLAAARALKSARQADIARGEFHEASRIRFRDYASEWVERYQGRGRGFRESSREDYRRHLERYAFPFFDGRLNRRTVSQVTPHDVARFVGWLCEQTSPSGRPLSDSTVRNIVSVVSACMSTAVREGLIRHNPVRDVALPHRPAVEELEADEVRVLSPDQLTAFLSMVHPRHRLFFGVLAATGLRLSEAIALQWRHVSLDGSSPHVDVRRAWVRGRIHPPKSRHGRRSVPLAPDLVLKLRAARAASEWPGDEDLVFPSLTGTHLRPSNLRRRVLKPVAEEMGAPWAGFHTFRHTCASLLFARGSNAKQVQKWLGHHSAAFTLATYIHLLDDDAGEPLALPSRPPVTHIDQPPTTADLVAAGEAHRPRRGG